MHYTYINAYHISSINTAFWISTPVWYCMNTNNIDIAVIFINSTQSNSSAYQFVTPGITVNYCVTMIISSMVFEL